MRKKMKEMIFKKMIKFLEKEFKLKVNKKMNKKNKKLI